MRTCWSSDMPLMSYIKENKIRKNNKWDGSRMRQLKITLRESERKKGRSRQTMECRHFQVQCDWRRKWQELGLLIYNSRHVCQTLNKGLPDGAVCCIYIERDVQTAMQSVVLFHAKSERNISNILQNNKK